MRYLSELRRMVEDLREAKGDGNEAAKQAVTISGERHTIIIYAAGPITIDSHDEGKMVPPKGEDPK